MSFPNAPSFSVASLAAAEVDSERRNNDSAVSVKRRTREDDLAEIVVEREVEVCSSLLLVL